MAKEKETNAATPTDPGAQYNPHKVILHRVNKRIEHLESEDFDKILLKYRSARFVREIETTIRTITTLAFHVDREEFAAVAEREAAEAAAAAKREAAAKAREALERVEQEAQTLAQKRAEALERAKELKAEAA